MVGLVSIVSVVGMVGFVHMVSMVHLSRTAMKNSVVFKLTGAFAALV